MAEAVECCLNVRREVVPTVDHRADLGRGQPGVYVLVKIKEEQTI
jgi:hypothetical protein